MSQRLAQLPAYALFYPVAAGYAALVLPLSVLAMTGRIDAFPSLAHPESHAHEMLLGFALAVVAGNQLGMGGGRLVVAMLLLWAAARVAFLLAISFSGILPHSAHFGPRNCVRPHFPGSYTIGRGFVGPIASRKNLSER